MQEWQERVLTEQKELAYKIIKLSSFITDNIMTKSLSEEEFNLLRRQLEIMFEYERVLQMRISIFKKN